MGTRNSRLSGFYKLDLAERIERLQSAGWLSAADADALLSGRHVLPAAAADRIIENVVGVFALPFAVAPNFRVNGQDYLVPLVVEEPSIVAALSNAAALARNGIDAGCEESLLAGQVHVTGHDESAASALEAASEELLEAANAVHPRLLARGGGARRLEVRNLQLPGGQPLLGVHVLVDTCDAMGANLVNSICEALAPRIAELAGGEVALRILSTLCDSALVRASVRFAVAALSTPGYDGETVRDGIVRANDIALSDPYRASTHNKGIMNGIDPVAIATGNDWRAIEAGAHAYAARSGRYRALTRWSVVTNGDLLGEIEIPLKVGIVGGTLGANPSASLALAMTGVRSAGELACLMAATGLLQNFGALRALVSTGIQQGHMRLHARSVAASAGASAEIFEDVVARLIESGDIKLRNAQQIVRRLQRRVPDVAAAGAKAAGKVILLGEHAVVYGKHALAVPIPNAVTATVTTVGKGISLTIDEWRLQCEIDTAGVSGVDALVMTIVRSLGLAETGYEIRVNTLLPRGMGLGSSAAIAVAIIRAFNVASGLELSNERVNEIAFECEKHAHGTPSGIDNTLATYGEAVLFSNDNGLAVDRLTLKHAPELLVAWGVHAGDTREQVTGVRARRDDDPENFAALFDQIDRISTQGAAALSAGDYTGVGRLMNICHGLLNAIGVSTPELERMVCVARRNGAIGAKLTGAGGGGSIVALCPGRLAEVRQGLRAAGFRTLDIAYDKFRE